MRTNSAVLELSESLQLMLDHGLTLTDALSVAKTVMRGARARRIVAELASHVSRGTSFSRAIAAMPATFPPVYRGMVAVGERVGSLERVFARLVTYLRTQAKLREKLLSAILYPALVLTVSIALFVVLATVVIPRMEPALSSLGGETGAELKRVLARARTAGIIMTVAAIIGGSLAAIVLLAPRLPGAFAARVDAATLGLPWAGPTLARARVLQLLFALETLSGGGVPVDTALVEAGNAVGDHAVSAAARRTAERVRLGMPLAPAFRAEPVIPERVCAWVGIGERTGDVTAVFSRLRSYLQAESERAGERFMTLIEPTLMIVVGAGMVALIAGVVLPVFAAFGGAL